MKNILVCGGFIGGHLANTLVQNGHSIVVADIKSHEYFDKAGTPFMGGRSIQQSLEMM